MRQVPRNGYLLVGSGKLANHWARFLYLHNLRFTRWSRSQSSEVALAQHLQCSHTVFVAISDDALDSFYDQHLTTFRGDAFHFSGSYYRDGFVGLHPLMTFSELLYPNRIYRALAFTVDDAKPVKFLDTTGNPYSYILPAKKNLYHALCVITANFPQMLWTFSLKEMEKLGVANEALHPLMTQALTNFLTSSHTALTGPHSRGDLSTIRANYQALTDFPEKNIYNAFTQAYATMLEETAHVCC